MRPSYSADTLTCATPDCPGVVFLLAKRFPKNILEKVLLVNQKRFIFGYHFNHTQYQHHEKLRRLYDFRFR